MISKHLFIIIFICSIPLAGNTQNMMVGAHFSYAYNLENNSNGFGGGARMGFLIFDNQMGLKAFYSQLSLAIVDSETYGISAYSYTALLNKNKVELHAFLEGGMSFNFRETFGSETSSQIGIGPLLKYWISDYLALELLCEYMLLGAIKRDTPSFQHLFVPTLSLSVKI